MRKRTGSNPFRKPLSVVIGAPQVVTPLSNAGRVM
jgi:hypothetical protein